MPKRVCTAWCMHSIHFIFSSIGPKTPQSGEKKKEERKKKDKKDKNIPTVSRITQPVQDICTDNVTLTLSQNRFEHKSNEKYEQQNAVSYNNNNTRPCNTMSPYHTIPCQTRPYPWQTTNPTRSNRPSHAFSARPIQSLS